MVRSLRWVGWVVLISLVCISAVEAEPASSAAAQDALGASEARCAATQDTDACEAVAQLKARLSTCTRGEGSSDQEGCAVLCRESVSAACDHLMGYDEDNHSILFLAQARRSLVHLRKACEAKDAASCHTLSRMFQTRTPACTRDRSTKACMGLCQEGVIDACREVAKRAHTDAGLHKRVRRTMDALQTGCNAFDMQQCYALGVIYERGRGRGIGPDPMASLALYEQACHHGKIAPACSRLKEISGTGGALLTP